MPITCLADSSCTQNYIDFFSLNNRSLQNNFGNSPVFSPYVTATVFGIDGTSITVGNSSSPNSGNTAAIKSFQWGSSDDAGVSIEIVDQQGGDFTKFVDKITDKFAVEPNDRYKINFSWGWIKTDCNGNSSILTNTKTHTMLILQIEVKMETLFSFVLKANTNMPLIAQGRAEGTFGQSGSGKTMALKDAIRQLFTQTNPKTSNVFFWKKNPDGTIDKGSNGQDAWEFDGDPKDVWRADQQNIISVVKKWIRPYKTNNGKGIIITATDTEGVPTVIFWEDGMPGCNEIDTPFQHLGSYIVNGGNCSNVLSFNTTMNWTFAQFANAGGFSNPYNSSNMKQQNYNDCNLTDQNAGSATYNVVSDDAVNTYGPDQAGAKVITADKAQSKADMHFRNYEPIQGELRIVGDPTLDDPTAIFQSIVGIVVINPFYLAGEMGCPTWIADSTCNTILSNNAWRVTGIAHDIRDSQYITIIKVFLATPGSEINTGEPLGGSSTGASVPVNT